MLINFYDQVIKDSKAHKKCPHTLNVIEAEKLVKSYSKEEQAKLAYHLNRWEWDESILGEFKGYEIAWEYVSIFTALVSKYDRFKYECLKVKGMTEEEFREAVIAAIYNAVLR